MTRLGVNIDHIATLREARREGFPDPVSAAKEAMAGGADGIVCHLREDRRHIKDDDLKRLRKLNTRLDLEMAPTEEMVRIALQVKPEMVTLVPEKRRELTTEGGLDVVRHGGKLKRIVGRLRDGGIKVSLFVDPVRKQVIESAILAADFIELHTGKYARCFSSGNRKAAEVELEKIGGLAQEARLIGLRVNAGHGLDYQNAGAIAGITGIEELNIGFSIIGRAVFVGIKKAVEEMRRAIQ